MPLLRCLEKLLVCCYGVAEAFGLVFRAGPRRC